MDIHTKTWSVELCESLGIEIERLAPIQSSLTEIGTLRPEIAEQMGLKSSTRIILGSGDEHAACLGAGVVDPAWSAI